MSKYSDWTIGDEETLERLYQAGCSAHEMVEVFKGKTYSSITSKLWRMGHPVGKFRVASCVDAGAVDRLLKMRRA